MDFIFSVKPFAQSPFGIGTETKPSPGSMGGLLQTAQPHPAVSGPPWENRSIATSKLRLIEFSAFVEFHREQDTVSDSQHVFYHLSY